MQLEISILSSIFMVTSSTQSVATFMAPSAFLGGVTRTSFAPSAQPIQMALFDTDTFPREGNDMKSLSISTYPKRMGVSEVFSVNLPKDMEEAAMSVIFSFDKGSKVKKHSHPASGKYF